MAPRRTRAKVSSSLIAFGRRFRRFREAKGWSQENLAVRARDGEGVTPQYIGAVETGRTRCTLEFAKEMDKILEVNGELIALWEDLAKDAAFPTWYEWLPIEETAEELTSWSLSLVHGLLQTPATPKYCCTATRRGSRSVWPGRASSAGRVRRRPAVRSLSMRECCCGRSGTLRSCGSSSTTFSRHRKRSGCHCTS
ncbi:helix-turn-helix domain-containing protein [Actinomadura sp. LD22]|uniref:Helix-turn-helix domain-containing protein n=1 Tax=Actinomadura physcomitrii TaxID=2650748 RepID=A0A6I4M416_9ACTN|nr:helix-turn-helix domain-containing protein [Actinomadura physcomitrii]